MAWEDYFFGDYWEDWGDEYIQVKRFSSSNYSGYNRENQYTKDTKSLGVSNNLISLLNGRGIIVESLTTAKSGSCYITFDDERIGGCRVGNHDEKKRLGYRWQVRLDINEKYISKEKGHSQFFYPSSDLDGLVRHIVNYYNKINNTKDEFECV